MELAFDIRWRRALLRKLEFHRRTYVYIIYVYLHYIPTQGCRLYSPTYISISAIGIYFTSHYGYVCVRVCVHDQSTHDVEVSTSDLFPVVMVLFPHVRQGAGQLCTDLAISQCMPGLTGLVSVTSFLAQILPHQLSTLCR